MRYSEEERRERRKPRCHRVRGYVRDGHRVAGHMAKNPHHKRR